MSQTSPEAFLAIAVIAKAVIDLKKGSKEHKIQARADIRNGCLDYWVDVVDSELDVGVEIDKRLRDIAS